MSVIVHPNENIDNALRRLHREVMREKILEECRDRAYRVKKAELKNQLKREWKKMKRRRRAASRRAR